MCMRMTSTNINSESRLRTLWLPARLNRKRQSVGVLGPAVGFPIGLGAHARRARHHVGVALRDNGNVAFVELNRLECGVANERYPARAAGDDVILDDVLSAGHDVV